MQAGGNSEATCGPPIVSGASCSAGQIVDTGWYSGARPVRWWMNQAGASNNTERGGTPLDPAAVRAELGAAFGTWEAVPESGIAFRDMGTTPLNGSGLDGTNLVHWSSTIQGTSVLAITYVTTLITDIDVSDAIRDLNGDTQIDLDPALYPNGIRLRAGTILDADIEFNAASFDWSLTPNPVPDICDIRAVAVHEAGHVHGLTHSAALVPLATMFAFFDTTSVRQQEAARSLEWDDSAASARAYPVAGVGPTGVLAGRVMRGTSGVVGAQVSAFELSTGRVVESVFSNASTKLSGSGTLLAAGTYRLDRLPPGNYRVGVEYLRRNEQTTGGWRWLDHQRAGYNETVALATLDPVDVTPELLSLSEGTADDLNPAMVHVLGAGVTLSLPNLVANTQYPAQPLGTIQLNMGSETDDTIVYDIPIMFPFPFYGTPYTLFHAYANGYLTFGSPLDLSWDESGASFFNLPRIAGLMRDLDPRFDGQVNGGPDTYVRLGPSSVEAIWLAVPEKISAQQSGGTLPTTRGGNTFTIGFDSTGKIWLDYQYLSSPFGMAGLSRGNGVTGVAEKFDFGRPRQGFPERPTLENAVSLSGLRVDFTPHSLGGYVASSPQWIAPEAAPPGAVGGLRVEGSDLTYLSWPASGVPRYHVYRGRVETLSGGVYTTAESCLTSTEVTQAVDFDTPLTGRVHFYLVSAVREFGIEGILGRNSLGAVRPNAVPCRAF